MFLSRVTLSSSLSRHSPIMQNFDRRRFTDISQHNPITSSPPTFTSFFLAIIGGVGLYTMMSTNHEEKSSIEGEEDRSLKEESKVERIRLIGQAQKDKLPVIDAQLTCAPNMPHPITRDYPVRLRVKMEAGVITGPLSRQYKYRFWGFNGSVPGPVIRARKGDVLEIQFTNKDENGVAHNIDFHAVEGPGGGAPALFAEQDETKTACFRLQHAGLFMYHCATGPIPMHISNGMYGMVLVEPEDGLPPVDKEFAVVQSEFYTVPSLDDPKKTLEYSYSDGLDEKPQYVLFNGKEGALTDNPLLVKTGERVRMYFVNAGPNLFSAFHIIGITPDKLYRDGDFISPPARSVQTALVPPGGATALEFNALVPGTYTLVDHAIHRIDKGAIGILKVFGDPRPDIYDADSTPTPCPGCKLHE